MGRGVGILVTAGFSRLALGTVPRMLRSVRLCLVSLLALLAVPVAAHAASVTVSGGTLTYNAGAGETNTAVIVKQQTTPVATVYFVGDQNPNVTVTASVAQGCLPTPPALGLPKGYLCTATIATPITSLVENLGDGNDTGVINSGTTPAGTISGGTGDDTLVGGKESDTFNGGTGTDSVAYVGIAAASITRTTPVTAVLPAGASPTTGNGQAGENDSIAADVEGLTGGNGNDNLTGNAGANTIAGSAPPGTPSVDPQPAGTESRDTINGGGGNDTLLSGDSGTVNGGDGDDTVIGGRSFANVTARQRRQRQRHARFRNRQRQPDRRHRVQHPRLRLRQPGRTQHRQSQHRRPRPASRARWRPAPVGRSAARRRTSSTATSEP